LIDTWEFKAREVRLYNEEGKCILIGLNNSVHNLVIEQRERQRQDGTESDPSYSPEYGVVKWERTHCETGVVDRDLTEYHIYRVGHVASFDTSQDTTA
jgi:hypothetical protein